MNDLLITTGALIRDTFREAFARKIFWGLFGLSTAMILFFLFLLKIDIVEGAQATVSMFGRTAGRQVEVQQFVKQTYAAIATFLYGMGMAVAVFASAGLIPRVLEGGRIELLLSKPVSRIHLLIGRYIGNELVVGCNIIYLVLGVWVIFGVKTGIWGWYFLLAIPTTMFMFAVLLSVVVLIGVLVESTALATMVTFALMLMSPILAQTRWADRLLSSEWSRRIWRGLYYALPKIYDMGSMTRSLVMERSTVSLDPLWSSALFAAVMLALAVWAFSKRDF